MEYSKKSWIYLLFWFAVIDVVFLPYMSFVTVTYSFVFVFAWFVLYYRIIRDENRDYINFVIMLLFMAISVIVGIALDHGSAKDNAVYFLQYAVTFMYFYLFKYIFDHYTISIKKVLIGFILFAAAVALVYFVNLGMYYQIRMIWSARASAALYLRDYSDSILGRYGFIWMDENNIGYIVNSVTIYLLCNEKTSIFEKVLIVVCDLFILVCCMSNGGMLTFAVGMGMLLFLAILKVIQTIVATHSLYVSKKSVILVPIVLAIVGIVVYKYLPDFMNTRVATAAFDRVEGNSADSRLTIYAYILQNVNFLDYFIFGHGVRTLVNGAAIKPHNVHFYYILVYGVLAYLQMMYITFRKRTQTRWIEYIWIFPFFLGASANIIIGEQKAMCVVMLMLAASTSTKYLEDRRNEKEFAEFGINNYTSL